MNAIPLKKAIALVGLTRLAESLGVRPPTLHVWMNRTGRAPAERCIAIERATGGKVTRYDLRPDVFGPAPDHHQAA